MDYAIENLRALEDSGVAYGVTETQEARFAGKALGAVTTGLSLHLVRPGRRQAFGHRHVEAEEIYVVLSGGGRVKLDEELVEIGPLDAIRVAPHVVRAFEAGRDGLELLAFGPRHPGDGEILGDVWGD